MKEIWKDVPGYEGLYQVSNLGRIRSYEKYKRAGRHTSVYYCPSKIIKSFSAGVGYQRVNLFKDRKGRQLSVHRLVAMAFIPNPDNLPQVNHKDEDKTNNRLDNLEWCTAKYNSNYGTHPYRLTVKGRKKPKKSKEVGQYTKSGELIGTYPSICEASRKAKVDRGSISNAINGRYLQAGGYYWRLIDK